MGLASLARSRAPVRSVVVVGDSDIVAVDAVESDKGGGSPPPNGFEMLTRYIPTETITLYVAAMAANKDITRATGITLWGIYWIAAVATPLILILLQLRPTNDSPASLWARLRWWPLVASFLAFLAWGYRYSRTNMR